MNLNSIPEIVNKSLAKGDTFNLNFDVTLPVGQLLSDYTLVCTVNGVVTSLGIATNNVNLSVQDVQEELEIIITATKLSIKSTWLIARVYPKEI